MARINTSISLSAIEVGLQVFPDEPLVPDVF
jgi:hypothetical protein